MHMSFEAPKKEQEQSPEEVEFLLREASEKRLFVDLIIVNEGIPTPTPHMLVEEIEDGDVYLSYLKDDGGLGEGGIPLQIKRIKGITLKEPYGPKDAGQ